MGVDTGISSGSGEVLIFSVGNVGAVFGQVLFGESEVYDVELVTALASSHQKVVGLDVSMQEVS